MNYAIIVAAGKGERFGKDSNKIWHEIHKKPILYHTIKTFEDCPLIDNIVVVYRKEEEKDIEALIKKAHFTKVSILAFGGVSRQESVYLGLMALDGIASDLDVVLVHNAANPCITQKELSFLFEKQQKSTHVAVGRPVSKSLKKVCSKGIIQDHLNRENIWEMETPQGSSYKILKEVHERARDESYTATDETELLHRYGYDVSIIETSKQNIKITTTEDAHKVTQEFKKEIQRIPFIRTGIGHDSHKFLKKYDPKKPLTLGGVVFMKENISIDANSDGDVILHGIFNAISQALGKRSIGYYADPMYYEKGIIDSKRYLKVILDEMKSMEYEIENIGISLECKDPKIEPKVEALKISIAQLCNISTEQVGVTATSGEGLTAFGRGEGIQCFVSAALIHSHKL